MYVRNDGPNYVPTEAWYRPSGAYTDVREPERSPFGRRHFAGLAGDAPKRVFGASAPATAWFDVSHLSPAKREEVHGTTLEVPHPKGYTALFFPVTEDGVQRSGSVDYSRVAGVVAEFEAPTGWAPDEVKRRLAENAEKVGAKFVRLDYNPADLVISGGATRVEGRLWYQGWPNVLMFLAAGGLAVGGVYYAKKKGWVRKLRRALS